MSLSNLLKWGYRKLGDWDEERYLFDEVKLPIYDPEACILVTKETEVRLSYAGDSPQSVQHEISRFDVLYDIFFVSALCIFTFVTGLDSSRGKDDPNLLVESIVAHDFQQYGDL